MINTSNSVKEVKFFFVMLYHILEHGEPKILHLETDANGRFDEMNLFSQHLSNIESLILMVYREKTRYQLQACDISALNSLITVNREFLDSIGTGETILLDLNKCVDVILLLSTLERVRS